MGQSRSSGPRARSSSDLQPRERVEYALTGHVEPAAYVKTGNLR